MKLPHLFYGSLDYIVLSLQTGTSKHRNLNVGLLGTCRINGEVSLRTESQKSEKYRFTVAARKHKFIIAKYRRSS